MSRFSRINTIWRKELIDTLRDRRTVIAMVLVPMVLYPALMLGSLQAIELQHSFLIREEYDVAVADEATQVWLRHVIDRDALRRESATRPAAEGGDAADAAEGPNGRRTQTARSNVREKPPPFKVFVVDDVAAAVSAGEMHVGILLGGQPPQPGTFATAHVQLVFDESEIRSSIAAAGLQGILERANAQLVMERLAQYELDPSFIQPLALVEHNVASAEKMAGAILGQIVPLILIIMTITGAIYPAIDLTAGERERGTLETLMAAPVPTVDLIAGKFVVVAAVGLMSALLNLLSIGGTVYLGGLGDVLTQGSQLVFPLAALPWVLLLLVPLAVMFSALLLAVCSFARSFKEAQNYVMPVMIAALIPAVVGILPGTRLEGPILVMPVANIVVLTRDLFMGRFDPGAILWVLMSTSLYAATAIAIAARLFGQEAVLFSDAGSVKTLFQRRFFKPADHPTAAAALLCLAVIYTLNFYVQTALGRTGMGGSIGYLVAIALTLVLLLGMGPLVAAYYTRVRLPTAFSLRSAEPLGYVAAICLGLSTWVLGRAWNVAQQEWLPMDPEAARMISEQFAAIDTASPWLLVLLLALIPALTEEWFFRGYVLSGLRGSIGRWGAILLVAFAFGLFHYSAHRLVLTTGLGILFGLLAIHYRSIWPAMLAHGMHNSLTLLSAHEQGLWPWLRAAGFAPNVEGMPAPAWIAGAAMLTLIGVVLCLVRTEPREQSAGAAAAVKSGAV